MILKTAVQGDKVMQDFELESLTIGGEHSQKVKAPSIVSDYGSKDCVNFSPSTAVSRMIVEGLKKRLKSGKERVKNGYISLFAPHRHRLAQYNEAAPTPEGLINLFQNEWLSALPSPYQHFQAGIYPLFEDRRIEWALEKIGIKNKKVLELGPLEGGHSYMLQKHGAASITAVEANPKAFLKCLLIKELFKLEKVHFLFGDFNAYLKVSNESFDCCLASGVLYHMKNPVGLLASLSAKCRELYLWTQYYDEGMDKRIKQKFMRPIKQETNGFQHTLYPFNYGASRIWSTFIGGPAKTSAWLTRDDILKALSFFGFKEIEIGDEEMHPEHGPSFALVAKKPTLPDSATYHG